MSSGKKNMRSIYLVLHLRMDTYPFSEMLCSVWTKSKNQVIPSNIAKFCTVIYYNFKIFNPKCISAPVSHPHNIWNWVTFSLTCEEDGSTKCHLHIMGVFCNLWLFCKDNIRQNASIYLILLNILLLLHLLYTYNDNKTICVCHSVCMCHCECVHACVSNL